MKNHGDLAERFKATVLKTVAVNSYRGFESPSHLTLPVLLNMLSFDDKTCQEGTSHMGTFH